MARREQLEEMLESDPDDVFLLYALAMSLAGEGLATQALQRLQQVLDRDANYVAAYFQRGQILAQQGQIEPARAAIRAGIEVAGDVGDTHAEQEMSAYLESL